MVSWCDVRNSVQQIRLVRSVDVGVMYLNAVAMMRPSEWLAAENQPLFVKETSSRIVSSSDSDDDDVDTGQYYGLVMIYNPSSASFTSDAASPAAAGDFQRKSTVVRVSLLLLIDLYTYTERDQLNGLYFILTFTFPCDDFPSVLCHCWLGDRKGILSAKKNCVGLLMVTIWLELCTCYSSGCHHHFHHP